MNFSSSISARCLSEPPAVAGGLTRSYNRPLPQAVLTCPCYLVSILVCAAYKGEQRGRRGKELLDGEPPRKRGFALLPAALALLLLALSGSFFIAAAQIQTHGGDMQVEESASQGNSDAVPRVIIEGTHNGNVYEVNQTVEVRGRVHGVMVFGGDVVIRGRVEGDVAAIGGSVFQTKDSFVGGDVIVLGGAYHHGKTAPGRNPASTTVMVAGLEQELRDLARTPESLLAPPLTPAYLGGRLLAILFWFIVSLALTAAVPGAISRAGTRLRLTSVRVALIGFVSLVVMLCGVPVSLRFLPAPLAAFVGALALLLVFAAYLFGRVVLHAATGQLLQRWLLPAGRHSESLALFAGVCCWVFILSLPYVWTLAVGGLLVVSLGLALTTRSGGDWKHPSGFARTE